MSEVERIEQQTKSLDEQAYGQLRQWFIEYDHARWDRQIEADSAAGKLDFLATKPWLDIAPGRLGLCEAFCQQSILGTVCRAARGRALADKSYALLKKDSKHPSLHFKKLGKFWSARIGLHHRALAVEVEGEMLWVWIGTHAEYDRLV